MRRLWSGFRLGCFPRLFLLAILPLDVDAMRCLLAFTAGASSDVIAFGFCPIIFWHCCHPCGIRRLLCAPIARNIETRTSLPNACGESLDCTMIGWSDATGDKQAPPSRRASSADRQSVSFGLVNHLPRLLGSYGLGPRCNARCRFAVGRLPIKAPSGMLAWSL